MRWSSVQIWFTSEVLRLSFHLPTLTCLFWIDRGSRSLVLTSFILPSSPTLVGFLGIAVGKAWRVEWSLRDLCRDAHPKSGDRRGFVVSFSSSGESVPSSSDSSGLWKQGWVSRIACHI